MEKHHYNFISVKPNNTARNYFYLLLKLRQNKINLHFNRTCKRKNLIPKYINVKIKNQSIAAQTSKRHAEKMWLTKVIKELYTKINTLTVKVYNIQLKLSKQHHVIEYTQILESVSYKIQKILNKKRKTIKTKLNSLKHSNVVLNHNSELKTTTHKFGKRITNLTTIKFTEREEELLKKGLKHNIHPNNDNHKEYNKHLLNIENSILKTKPQEQQEIRSIIVTELRNNNHNNTANNKTWKPSYKSDKNTVQTIQSKLTQNNAMITKADKGNTLVIIEADTYNNKINQYIENNEIQKITTDPTSEYNARIKRIINKSNNIMSDRIIRWSKAIKPTAPRITGLPKIHKPDIPVRPLINFTTAPAYKIAKHVNILLKQHIKLQNNCSVKNNIELIDKIQSINIPHNATLASFDIKDMYTNIPVGDTIDIIKNLLITNGTKPIDTNEIINLITEITKQNYFTHNNEYFTQTKGLPMGSPLSGTLAEIYLNHFENKHINTNNNPHKDNIMYWHRYVDDIIILFKGTRRQLHKLHQYINSKESSIQFTLETETDKSINFLDLNIKNNNSKHTFKIYRKPTETDHTIHKHSHHPHQHKIAAYRHMTNRLNNVPMEKTDYDEELNNIKYIAQQNGYNEILIDRLNRKHISKKQLQNMTTLTQGNNNIKDKYISVEYNKNTHKIIQQTFKKIGYKTAYKSNNKLLHKLTKRQNNHQETDTGVYKLTCNDCDKFYIGQTGRSFLTRYKEHISDINRTTPKSNYAQHLKTEKHNYNSYESNLTIIHKTKKGPTLNRLEEIEIYRNKDDNNLLNDKINTRTNRIYDLILENEIT